MSTTEPTEESVRAEVRAWLKANWNPDLGLVEWREKLCESGWGAPHWPKQWYGRDLPVKFNAIVDEEFAQGRRGRRRQGRHPHARRRRPSWRTAPISIRRSS